MCSNDPRTTSHTERLMVSDIYSDPGIPTVPEYYPAAIPHHPY